MGGASLRTDLEPVGRSPGDANASSNGTPGSVNSASTSSSAPGSSKTRNRVLEIRSSLVLLLTAFIWGIAFVAQRIGMEYIGPFLFAGLRFWLGGLVLLLVVLVSDRKNTGAGAGAARLAGNTTQPPEPSGNTKTPQTVRQLVKAGIICGCFLITGSAMQQIGMVYTTASKAGFLTALYIVLVPVLGIFIRQKTHWNAWVGVVLAVAGLYFLSITDSLTILPGDAIVVISAFFWAGHILATDYFVGNISQRDVMRFCVVQFLFAGTVAMLLAPFADRFFVENVYDFAALKTALVPILYAGVLSTGAAFTLQAIGQQGLPAAPAAIIMSLESVFSVLGGMVILSEALSGRETLGCVLMFAAVIIAQLPRRQTADEHG